MNRLPFLKQPIFVLRNQPPSIAIKWYAHQNLLRRHTRIQILRHASINRASFALRASQERRKKTRCLIPRTSKVIHHQPNLID